MQYDGQGPAACAQQVCRLPMSSISPRQTQPFGREDSASLTELAASIQRDGLIRPITVRRTLGGRYVIVSGNRRYMACRMAGFTHIDAVIMGGTPDSRPAQALIAALQGGRMHYLEEAEALRDLTGAYGITRDALARSLGRTSATIAQKIRLMELDEDLRAFLLEEKLPERCARALLRLPDRHARMMIARQAASQKLCIRDVELLVSSAVSRLPVPPPPGGRTIALMRDHRLYMNAIYAIIAQMQEAGIDAKALERPVGEDSVELVLRVPTRRKRAENASGGPCQGASGQVSAISHASQC